MCLRFAAGRTCAVAPYVNMHAHLPTCVSCLRMQPRCYPAAAARFALDDTIIQLGQAVPGAPCEQQDSHQSHLVACASMMTCTSVRHAPSTQPAATLKWQATCVRTCIHTSPCAPPHPFKTPPLRPECSVALHLLRAPTRNTPPSSGLSRAPRGAWQRVAPSPGLVAQGMM